MIESMDSHVLNSVADERPKRPTPQLTTVRTKRRNPPTTLIASLGLLLTMVVGVVSTSTTSWSRAQSTPGGAAAVDTLSDGLPSGETALRVREGTRFDEQSGTFTSVGERWAFTPAGTTAQLVVLENLVLDRVSRVLGESAEPAVWSVSGRVTEYRGANYLLLDRAVVRQRGSIAGSGEAAASL
ncbi:MAG: hypothetical protein R3C10_10910 [Pirellulales bacterium]|nr:hypothetical protein [Planctomycetales bacterium]